jgi:hypothetical protein
VTDHDDSWDDMRTGREPTEQEADRLVSGESVDGFEHIAELFVTARHELTAAPSAERRAQDIVAMVEAAREESAPAVAVVPSNLFAPARPWRRAMDRGLSLGLKACAAAAGLFVAVTGLAYAGVNLPGHAAEDAVEAVLRVDLPNQDHEKAAAKDSDAGDENGKSSSDGVHSVIENSTEKGCEFGQAVSAAARGEARTSDNDPCDKSDNGTNEGNAKGHAKAAKAKGKAHDGSNGTDKAKGHDGSGDGKPDDAGKDGDHGQGTGSSEEAKASRSEPKSKDAEDEDAVEDEDDQGSGSRGRSEEAKGEHTPPTH